MAHLANCPQCDHELLVPDGIVAGSWVRCPGCQAHFQMKDARARELPLVEVITSAPEPTSDDEQARPTVADNSDLGGLRAIFDSSETAADDSSKSHLSDAAGGEKVSASEAVHMHVADIEDSAKPGSETPFEDTPTEESPEAAAERIDAWFRSAKTLPDVPAVESGEVDYSTERESLFGPNASDANNATIEIGSTGIQELSDDFELEVPHESPTAAAPWDDTQHMEQLLAGAQDQPQDEQMVAATQGAAIDEDGDGADAVDWTHDQVLSIVPKTNKPRRKKSIVRTFVMTAVGGIMGLALGYYALLWIRGPEIDFLEVSKYLPQSILPASFKTASRQMAAAPPVQPKATDTASEPAEPPAVATHELAKSADATEATPKPIDAPAEELASFTEPADVAKTAEPATFDAPPAAPLKEDAPIVEPIQINGAPSFTVAELSAALEAGKDAEAGLVTGRLGDSHEVDRAKGLSYLTLADLAQKATFVDGGSSDEVATLTGEADELFRKLLAEAHTRDEVGQIVFKWIASPNRKHGGVFFGGKVLSHEAKGSVSECSVVLGGGQTLPVLIPAALGEKIKASQSPVAVVGWIVDEPAKDVTGYTGAASQAVFAPRLIPLE